MLIPMLCLTYESVAAVMRQMASASAAWPAQPARIRDEDRVADAGPPFKPLEELIGVGHLRDRLGETS